jgi:transposase
MQLHLDEIAKDVAPGRHAVLLLDQAGWHMSSKLDVPGNLTLVPLPAKCPELNPAENVWEFMRDNWLSNRVFHNADDLIDHCCEAWNKLRSQPWRLMSIGMREWAHKFSSTILGIRPQPPRTQFKPNRRQRRLPHSLAMPKHPARGTHGPAGRTLWPLQLKRPLKTSLEAPPRRWRRLARLCRR